MEQMLPGQGVPPHHNDAERSVLGAMLISSLIVFPGLTAMRVFKSFRKVLLCALAVSVVCFFAGLCASFALSVPTGASVVVANVAVFLLFSLIGKLRKTY